MENLQTKGQAFKKQLILSEASAILFTKPYESVSMDEVAKSLGCSKATLYKHFASKDALFGEVIFNKLETFVRHIEELTADPPDTLGAIRTCFSECYDFFAVNRNLFSSWMSQEPSGSAGEFFSKVRALLKAHEHCIQALFEKGIAEGLVNPFNAKMLASTIENIFLSCVFCPIPASSEAADLSKHTLQAVLINGIFTENAIRQLPEARQYQ